MNSINTMPVRHPLSATLELTLRCNLKCKMCMFRKTDEHNASLCREELSATKWADLAKQLFDAGTLNILLTGGEPLLRKDFTEIYKSIYRLGFIVTLYTNATLVTDEIMQTLRTFPPHRIGITLYGASNETYNALCGCANGFDKALAGARALKTLPSVLEFRTTVVQENFKDINALEALVKEEFDSVITHSTNVFGSVRGGCMPVAECRLTPEQTVDLTLNRMRNRLREALPQELANKVQISVAENKPECKTETYSLLGCGGGMNNATITYNGKLLGCQMLENFSTNAVTLGFAKAWEEWPFTVRLPKLNAECASCPHINLCHICPGVRMAECGNLQDKPEYICKITKYLATKKGGDL